jgi:hypothetical protein
MLTKAAAAAAAAAQQAVCVHPLFNSVHLEPPLPPVTSLDMYAGVLVVSSAGNYQESLLNYLPAACPTVAAVTSIDPSTSAPSVYSNFLPADVSDAAKARVIAAPGNGVLSTISIQRESTRYR